LNERASKAKHNDQFAFEPARAHARSKHRMSSSTAAAAATADTGSAKRQRVVAGPTTRSKARSVQARVSADTFHYTLYTVSLTSRYILFRLPPENIVSMLFLTKEARRLSLAQAQTILELLRTFYPYAAIPDAAAHAISVFCMLSRRRTVRSAFEARMFLGARQFAIEMGETWVDVNKRWPLRETRRVYELSAAYRAELERERLYIQSENVGIFDVEDGVRHGDERWMRGTALNRYVRKRNRRRADLRHTIADSFAHASNAWVDTLWQIGEKALNLSWWRTGVLRIANPEHDHWTDLDVTAIEQHGLGAVRESTGTLIRDFPSDKWIIKFAEGLYVTRAAGVPTSLCDVARIAGEREWRVLARDIPSSFLRLSFDEVRRVLYMLWPTGVWEVDVSDESRVTPVLRAFSKTTYVARRAATLMGPLLVDATAGVVTTCDLRHVDARGRLVVHRYRPRTSGGVAATSVTRSVVSKPGNLLVQFTDIAGYHYPQFLARPMPWEVGRAKEDYARLK